MHKHPRVLFASAIAIIAAAVGIGIHNSQPAPSTDPDQNTEQLGAAQAAGRCGLERWSVKVATDADAGKINTTPIDSSVGAMRKLKVGMITPNTSRQPLEQKVYRIHATLTFAKAEADSDYHLVIRDAAGTMIVESPSPSCAKGSLFLQQITDVRKAIDAKVTVTATAKKLSYPVTVTGVAFQDFLHGQTGVSPNGMELHPLLSIAFG